VQEQVDRFRVVPAAYVLLRRGDEVLLQRRRNTGYYDEHWAAGAAGHVEAGESVFEAACRETAEELGIEVAADALIPLTTMHRTANNGRAIDERVDVFFECRDWTGEPALQEDKASDLGWFRLGDLPQPVVPHELVVLEGVRSGVLPSVVAFGF
jgi:8-oxo-dGTP diphosphatase